MAVALERARRHRQQRRAIRDFAVFELRFEPARQLATSRAGPSSFSSAPAATHRLERQLVAGADRVHLRRGLPRAL